MINATCWRIGRMASGRWRWCLVDKDARPIIFWQHRGTKQKCEEDIALVRDAVKVDVPVEYNALAY